MAALRRGSTTVVANLSERRVSVRLDSPGWEPAFTSGDGCHIDRSAGEGVSVPAESAAVLVKGQQ